MLNTEATENLDIYLMTDQPADCPRCQRRTLFEDLGAGVERHTCIPCGYEFLMHSPEVDGEEQCEYDDCRDFTPLEDLNKDGICPTCAARGVVYCEACDDYAGPLDHDHDEDDD